MLQVLKHRTYRRLFMARVLSLIGTGMTTVALGLLAYDLAGADAGAVLGTALALKMVAYVGIAPIAGAFASRLPRRPFLVTLDLCRAGLVLLLPFVSEIWHVYVLVFAFQSFSAAFTPTFQATIPDLLENERDYTNALSLSRLAYDLESLTSPLLAGVLLAFISFIGCSSGRHWAFSPRPLWSFRLRYPWRNWPIRKAAFTLASREACASIWRRLDCAASWRSTSPPLQPARW